MLNIMVTMVNGKRIQQSLNTRNKRVALDRKRQIEYQLASRGLVLPSETHLAESPDSSRSAAELALSTIEPDYGEIV